MQTTYAKHGFEILLSWPPFRRAAVWPTGRSVGLVILMTRLEFVGIIVLVSGAIVSPSQSTRFSLSG